MTLADAKDLATIIGTFAAIIGASVAIYKTFDEIRKGRLQREADHRLRRADFTLAQHRRLFDDPTLFSVLSLLDDDDPKLAKHEYWDPKRKFITFIEELCLLANAGYIDNDVAHYLFGYYATKAYDGVNFRTGLDWTPQNWGLFFSFAEAARPRLETFSNPDSLKKLAI